MKNKQYIIKIKSKYILSNTSSDNRSSEDITEEIQKYLGPNYDWHNIEYTPSFFKHKTLTFHYSNGEVKEFSENEILK